MVFDKLGLEWSRFGFLHPCCNLSVFPALQAFKGQNERGPSMFRIVFSKAGFSLMQIICVLSLPSYIEHGREQPPKARTVPLRTQISHINRQAIEAEDGKIVDV